MPVALGMLMLLSGCDAVQNAVSLNRAYPPPSATGAFDGSYYGRARVVRAQPGVNCPQGRIGVMEVGDKRLSFAYAPEVIFNPAVAADGTVHDTVGPAVLDGKITDDMLVMRVTTPQCDTSYRLSFVGNHS
jgi:hypothetical protein